MILFQKIIVHGKVQGVYYRQTTFEKAIELGLKGFVKNQDDGTVLIEAEGTPSQLDQLAEWCYIGSVMSKVVKIEVYSGELKGFEQFKIIRK